MVKLESSVKNRVLALTLASTLVVGMIPFNAYGFNDTPSDQKQQTQTELKTIKSIPIGYSLVYGLSDNNVFKNENGEEIELTKIGKKSFVDFGFQKNSRYFWKYKFETNDQKGYLVVDKGLTVELKSEDQTINLNKIVSAANKDVYQYSAAGVLYVNGTENSVELGKVWSVGTNDGKTAVTEENITDVDLYFPDLDKKDLNKKIVYSIEKKDSCINLTTKQYNSDFQVALQSTSSDLYSQDKVSFAVEKNKDNKILENLKTDICVSTDGVTYESITEQNEYFINEKADYLNVKAVVSLSEDKILIEKEDKFVVKNGNPSVSNVSASVDNSILNILSFGIFANKEMTISAKIKDDGQKNYDEVLINDKKAEYNKDSDSYDIKLSSETYNTKPITIVLYSNSSTNKEKVLEYSTNTVYDKDNKEYKLKDDYKTVVLEQNKENSPKITITKDIIKEKVALDFSVNDAAKTEGSKNPGLNCTKVVIDKIILEDGKEKTENVVEYNKVNKIIEPDRDIANLNIKLNQTKDTAKNYKGGIITKNDFQLKINTDENKINIPDGKYRVTIKAINNVNNESSETVYFTIENPKPKVSVNISDSSGNNNTLNYKDKAIIKISVSDKNLTADKLKKDFNYSLKGVVNDNKTEIKLNEFKLNDSGKFVSETTIDTEGKYELNIVSITNDIGVSWEDGYNKKFTVDKNIPDINFEFDESIQNMIKEMLSFGLFTNEDVLVKVKFSDKISGINKDSIKIKNEDKDIDVSKSLEETEDGYLCKFMLNKEEAYKLKATVYDNAGRSNTVDALNNIIITSTDAEPTAKITELDGKVYNQKINVSITAESRRNEAHALPGLKAVSVKLLRKEKNGEFTTVFEDKDDGNSLSDRLVRVDNIRKDFSKTIIDKCDYTYSIDPEEKEVGSGYYKIVVTTVNNVFNKNIDNVTTTQKSGVFSLDIEPPNVDVSLKGTPKKIGDYDVYDQNTELTIKVSDVNISYEDLNKMEYSFTKTDPDGNNSTIDISSERWIQVQDGEGGVKNFTKTIKLDDEGFYEFSFTAIKDKLSDDMSNTQNTEITKKFAVDDKQPDIKVKYVFSNVVEEMLNILSFGIYSGKPVKAEITVTDKIAGVDKDKIFVENSVDDSTIENVTFTSSDKRDKTCSATIDLSKDTAYKISVTADDKLNRQTGNEISKTAKFSEDKDNISVIDGDVEKEIANTDDTPSISVTQEPSEWTDKTKNVEYAFNVVSDKEFKGADPGLNSVVVSMLKWDYDKDNWFDEPVAVVTDDGGSIVNENNDFINFERTENKTANFKKDKITSQNYSLKLNTKSTNPLNISGKYKIKVDVYNNSVDADNNRYSATTEKEFGLDYEAPKISVKYDWADNDSNNIESVFGQDTYYNADRKITVEVKEYNFNLNDVKVTFANIITDEKGSNSSLEWEKKGNDFTGTFTFTDDPGEPNDGKYTVDIGRFSDPSGKSAVDEKDELYDGNNDKFIIDKTAPQIKVNFKWVENDSNNKKSVYGQDTYYNADKMITVVVTEHNFTLDYVKDTFANVITDEKDSKHSLEWLDNNDNTFTGTFIFTDDPGEPNDGKYAVNISKFTDHAENSAVNENGVLFSGEKDEFVIDTTKPIIDVSYSNLETKVTSHNGYDYYKAENIVATIAVTEHCFNNTNFKVSFKQLNIDGSQKNEVVVNDSNSNEWTHTTINNNNVYKLEVVIPGNNRYNNFWVDVTDLAGNSDEYRYDKKFVIDNTPPVRLNYSYDRAPIEKFIEVVTIGAYKSNIIVTLEGMDDVAGIKKIDYNYVGIGNSPSLDGVKEFEGEGASASFRNYSFNVKPNFKGYIIFRVTDFCGNVTEFNSRLTDPASGVTNGIVVDDRNPNIDKVAPVIKINPTGTPRNNIFNSDVKVNVEVNDPIVTGVSSGVSRIEYYIVNKTTNARFPATNYQVINNTVDKKSSNFNTSFEIDSKTFNSNNVEIVIMAYDNAGNSTEARKTISIDITAPVISVTYDNMQASKTGDTEYYKTDRTATITVTERNFDPADINYSVKNAHNVVPKLEGWTENKNNTDPDKTTHTAKIRYTADGDYTFDISFKDKAGNEANKIKTQKFTLDKTLPKIEVSYQNDVSPQNSNYYKKHRTAVIRINEHNFSWDGFNINFDIKGSDNQTKASAPSVSKSSAGSDVYTATVSFNHDGVFKFNVTYTDLAKNSARPFDSGTFYIDTSAPKIRIDGIKSNQAFDNNLTFTATVDEINYAGDVEYNIVRSDTQKKDYSSEVFKVSKSGDGKVITCNSPKKDKSTDGIYTFTITATDKAGNAETKSVKFSVNRFGSTYEVADDYSKNLLEKNKCVSKVNDIRIREVNVDEFELDEIIMVRGSDNAILSSNGSAEKGNLLICGEPEKKVEPNGWYSVIYTIKASNFTEDGPYSIKIKSKDKKLGKTYTNEDVDQSSKDKNETKYIMSFVVDSTKPLVSISGIESGIPYEEASKTITINCDDFNLDSDTLKILIGGKEYNVDKENIEASDGKLKIKFDIKASDYPDFIDLVVKISDNAGNVSEAKIEHFKLSASLLERFFINTPLVIAVFGGLGLLIVASIILIVVKRKNS